MYTVRYLSIYPPILLSLFLCVLVFIIWAVGTEETLLPFTHLVIYPYSVKPWHTSSTFQCMSETCIMTGHQFYLCVFALLALNCINLHWLWMSWNFNANQCKFEHHCFVLHQICQTSMQVGGQTNHRFGGQNLHWLASLFWPRLNMTVCLSVCTYLHWWYEV